MKIESDQNKDNEESQKNVSEKWLDYIYQSIVRLEEFERIARDGAIELIQLLQIPEDNLNEVRLKNIKLMLTEFDILLSNIRPILKKEDFNNMRSSLKSLTLLYEGKLKNNETGENIEVYKYIHTNKNKYSTKRKLILNTAFEFLIEKAIELRAELVNSVSHILFSTMNPEEQQESFD